MERLGDDAAAVNVRFWDELAAAHGHGDAYYDLDALAAGRSSLSDVEAAAVHDAVGDVDGLDILHVQCHLGMDAVSLARQGARVTGLDFSPVAVERARELASRCGVEVEYVEADSTRLPSGLIGRFDVAYASMGVLCWIADLDAWMTSVRSALRPGGHLVVVDLHPLFLMMDSTEPLHADFPYAYDGPRRIEESESYAGGGAAASSGHNVNYAHSLGELVSAAVRAGLRVDALREHLDAAFDPRGDLLQQEDDGRFRFRLDAQPLPVLYTLLATRAGGAGAARGC
jgi:SAM-dependent methyltransferase